MNQLQGRVRPDRALGQKAVESVPIQQGATGVSRHALCRNVQRCTAFILGKKALRGDRRQKIGKTVFGQAGHGATLAPSDDAVDQPAEGTGFGAFSIAITRPASEMIPTPTPTMASERASYASPPSTWLPRLTRIGDTPIPISVPRIMKAPRKVPRSSFGTSTAMAVAVTDHKPFRQSSG